LIGVSEGEAQRLERATFIRGVLLATRLFSLIRHREKCFQSVRIRLSA